MHVRAKSKKTYIEHGICSHSTSKCLCNAGPTITSVFQLPQEDYGRIELNNRSVIRADMSGSLHGTVLVSPGYPQADQKRGTYHDLPIPAEASCTVLHAYCANRRHQSSYTCRPLPPSCGTFRIPWTRNIGIWQLGDYITYICVLNHYSNPTGWQSRK